MALVETTFDAAHGIAHVTINRPEVLNALDVPTAKALYEAIVPLAEQSGLRCVVLQGAGRAFIAGGDVSAFAADPDGAGELIGELLDYMHPVIETMRAIDAPVIAGVHGAVAGGGLSLMSACDLVVAAEGTRFLIAYDRIGGSPDCSGTYFLPRLVGVRRAAELMLLSQTWDAETAREAGLINRVVAEDALDSETRALAEQVAAGPTRSYGYYKRLVDQAFCQPLSEQLADEREAFIQATHTHDFRVGTAAFVSKSKDKPDFKGY